jgi:hypothetical protein
MTDRKTADRVDARRLTGTAPNAITRREPESTPMRNFLASFLILAVSADLWCADQVLQDNSSPVSTVNVISPLSIEEAQKWSMYCQIMPVKEKDGLLVDTAAAKNQVILIHSISYFKSASGQLYAIVNFLRPKTDDAKR